MANEIARRPYGGEMVPLRTIMDRLFENAFMAPSWAAGRAQNAGALGGFTMDVEEDDDAFYVRCHLPGVNPDDVSVSVQDDVLTVSGELKRNTPEGRRAVLQESGAGRFQRQVALGTPVDAAKAQATYEHGVLEITLPKSAASKPRTIPVRTGGGAAAHSNS